MEPNANIETKSSAESNAQTLQAANNTPITPPPSVDGSIQVLNVSISSIDTKVPSTSPVSPIQPVQVTQKVAHGPCMVPVPYQMQSVLSPSSMCSEKKQFPPKICEF